MPVSLGGAAKKLLAPGDPPATRGTDGRGRTDGDVFPSRLTPPEAGVMSVKALSRSRQEMYCEREGCSLNPSTSSSHR